MIAIGIFILIVIGLNLVPQLTKWNLPKVEKVVNQLLILTTSTFIVLTILSFNGYKLKGLYSNVTFGIVFFVTAVLYFTITQYTKRKLLSILILVPLILLSFLTTILGRPIYERNVGDNHKIQVCTGGIMSCGELIRLTESELLIFDKEILHESSLCLREIERIETVTFNQNSAKFLIYHNGELVSENPFQFNIKNINVW